MSKVFTVVFTRIELNWLYRQLMTGRDRAAATISALSGPVATITDEQRAQLSEAREHHDALQALTDNIREIMDQGDKHRLKIKDIRDNLEEAKGLVEEESALEEIERRLMAMPTEEPYRVQFDRATVKFTLRLVENDLQKFRTHIIPTYENSKPEDHKDPVQTKSYWVNKSRQSKAILESLKAKLEKTL